MRHEKICVVTGGTGGIGKFVARGMAEAGYLVVIVGRDRARGEAAKAWIEAEVPGGCVDLVITDLALLAGTAAFGREIAARYGRIDVLILNAGVFLSRREVTAEGHDMVLAVNHLSPFVLIRTLADTLRAHAPARVVTVGSSSSDRARIAPEHLELTRGWGMVRAYSQSKLAVMMTSFTWAERFAGSGVTVNVVHPGFVATGLVRTPGVIGFAWRLLRPFARTEADGAKPPLYAALAPEHAATTGQYFKDRGTVAPNARALDADLRARVWAATERLVD